MEMVNIYSIVLQVYF